MSRDELKEWLAAHKHSAVSFAALLGVTERTVYRWLAGTTPIPKWLGHAVRGLAR
jgi:DNA-binding transcriptional regulator YiaG